MEDTATHAANDRTETDWQTTPTLIPPLSPMGGQPGQWR